MIWMVFLLISLDPNDPNLGNGLGGTFTLVAVAIIDNEQSEVSGPITLTIDCPVPPPVITQPDTQDCEGAILIEGTAHPETDEIVLSIQGGPELGRTTDIDDMDGSWSISLDPNDPNLGNGLGGDFYSCSCSNNR